MPKNYVLCRTIEALSSGRLNSQDTVIVRFGETHHSRKNTGISFVFRFLCSKYPQFIKTDRFINGSFTLPKTDSGMDSGTNPIPVFGSWDWNLNLTLCSVKTSA